MLMRYKRQIAATQLNLLDSHDVSRFLDLCGGDVRRLKLAVMFMCCFPGMPCVFYGDELGVAGADECVLVFERKSPDDQLLIALNAGETEYNCSGHKLPPLSWVIAEQ